MSERQSMDLGCIIGPAGAPGAKGDPGDPGPGPTADQVNDAFEAYMTAHKEARTLVRLTASETWAPPTLNRTLYYSNQGIAAHTLSITLPAEAGEGDEFRLDFRSEGTQSIPAVIAAFGVESGGCLVMHGELSDTAYYTRIRAVFEQGVWVADITTYGVEAGVLPTTYTSIVYSGANRAATASQSYTDTVPVGNNILSTQYFRSLYGLLPFAGWNTALDGTGTSYGDGELVEVGNNGLTLYPQYSPYEAAVPKPQQWNAKDKTGSVNGSITVTPTIAGYSELSIKVKASCRIYAHNSGGRGTIALNGQTVASLDGRGGNWTSPDPIVTSWITLTRATATDPFILPILCGVSAKSFDFYVTVTHIRYE